MSPPAIQIEAADDTTPYAIPDPLTLTSVEARRSKAGQLRAGVAAAADINLFKGRGQHLHKPLAKDWSYRMSEEAKSRKLSSLKGASKYLSKPGIISLGGGLPSSEYFPIDELSIKVPSLGAFSEQETHEHGTTLVAGKHDVQNDKSIYDLSIALNYGLGAGAPQLLRFMVEHTELIHDPPYQDWACTMNIGNTSGWDMLLRMFGARDTYFMTEEYSFSSAVETAAALGMEAIGIPIDDEGLLPDAMDAILSSWSPSERSGAPKPHILYTVPSGQNPTGATQSLPRRKAIYAVAQKHDVLIVEDEPYYFLQMQPYTGSSAPDPLPPASHAEFIKSLVPSLLSMDTDGRVMRLDSFSKVIAPGARVGWLTAPAAVCTAYSRAADSSTQMPSGLSQIAMFKLLDEHWGHGGYLDWLLHIRLAYSSRRNVMLGACEEFLPRELVRWKAPMAGMFHWVEVDWRLHPLRDSMSVDELEERIWLKTIEKGVLPVRGSWFAAEKGKNLDRMFFRMTYAAAPEDKIVEAVRRFGLALREEFEYKDAPVQVNGVNGHANGH